MSCRRSDSLVLLSHALLSTLSPATPYTPSCRSSQRLSHPNFSPVSYCAYISPVMPPTHSPPRSVAHMLSYALSCRTCPPPSPVLLPRALFIRIPCCLLLYLSVLLYLLFVLVHSCCVYNSRCSIGGCRGRGQEGPLYLCSHLPILFPPCSLSPPCLLVPSASPYLFTYPLCLTLPRGRPPGLATFGYLARHPCV